jgi:hypothetical protein
MRRIRLGPNNFNDLPLWGAAREADLQSLPLPARRIARRFGMDASTARLVVQLAGLGDGGRDE